MVVVQNYVRGKILRCNLLLLTSKYVFFKKLTVQNYLRALNPKLVYTYKKAQNQYTHTFTANRLKTDMGVKVCSVENLLYIYLYNSAASDM